MSEFNLPLLRKAVEWAESEARKPQADSEWYQDHFAVSGEAIGRSCGTAYCIAGWIAHQAGSHRIELDSIDGDGSAMVAQELLGITHEDAWCGGFYEGGLFAAGNSIEDVRLVAETIARRYGEEL